MRIPAWLKGMLLLAATFAGGVAAGIGYERRQAVGQHAGAMEDHGAMQRLVRDLDLDSLQQQAITEILTRHQKDVDATWHLMQPHVRATLDSTHQDIERVLRPEQLATFRTMMQRMHPAGHR